MGTTSEWVKAGARISEPEVHPPGTVELYRATALAAAVAAASLALAVFLPWGSVGFSRAAPAVAVNGFRHRTPNADAGILEFWETNTDWTGVAVLVIGLATVFFVAVAARRTMFWSRFWLLFAVALPWAATGLIDFASHSPSTYWQQYVQYAKETLNRPATPVREPALTAPTPQLQHLVDTPQGPGLALAYDAVYLLLAATVLLLVLDCFRDRLPASRFSVRRMTGGALIVAGLLAGLALLRPWVSRQSPWPSTTDQASPDIVLSENGLTYQTYHFAHWDSMTAQSTSATAELFAAAVLVAIAAGVLLIITRGVIAWLVGAVAAVAMPVLLIIAARYPTTLVAAPSPSPSAHPDPFSLPLPTSLTDYGSGLLLAALATIGVVVALVTGGAIAWRARAAAAVAIPQAASGDAVLPHPVDERDTGTVGEV